MIPIPNVPAVNPLPPGTQIYLCKGIPWDMHYKHVRLFGSKSAALSYIQSKAVYTTTLAKPVRGHAVPIDYTQSAALENCNYIAYNNKNIDDFWVFGFITGTRYASTYVTEFSFEIDVFQTYFYSCTLSSCFVRRHHWARSVDFIGANTLPEPINLGTYRTYKKSTHFDTTTYAIGIYHAGNYEYDYFGDVSGMFTGVKLKICDTAAEAQSFINTMIEEGKETEIALIQMIPQEVLNKASFAFSTIDPLDCFDFTPKNNKLYTYPFCYAHVDNNAGNTRDYYFELSDYIGHIIRLYSDGEFMGQPTLVTRPQQYNGSSEDFTAAFVTNNFPTCPFTGNSYAQWLNANQINMGAAMQSQTLSAIASATKTMAVGAVTGGVAGLGAAAAMSALNSGVNIYNTGVTQRAAEETAKNAPNSVHGEIAQSVYNITHNRNKIEIYIVGIDPGSAQAADDFMCIYGYATDDVVVPNLNTRTLWNYVETADCNVQGDVSYKVRETLNAIFNAGVFVWHTNNIGNFNIEGNG